MEPFAGGAGSALTLLFSEHVQEIIINDADICIYYFWHSVLNDTDRFTRLISDTPITVEEWRRQREIYRNAQHHSPLEVGFATFFLNRCNRSGIIKGAGVIGGLMQEGPYKIDARYNKVDLIARIESIASYRSRITIFNLDAILFLEQVEASADLQRTFIYLDPPYYIKGKELYLNHYNHEDHVQLCTYLRSRPMLNWVLTYDNATEIINIYHEEHVVPFSLSYSAHSRREGKEILIYNPRLVIPHHPTIAA